MIAHKKDGMTTWLKYFLYRRLTPRVMSTKCCVFPIWAQQQHIILYYDSYLKLISSNKEAYHVGLQEGINTKSWYPLTNFLFLSEGLATDEKVFRVVDKLVHLLEENR